jgi:hypothetical protein
MRGIVFPDLVAAIGARGGALHDVIEALQLFITARDIAAVTLRSAAFVSSDRIFDK